MTCHQRRKCFVLLSIVSLWAASSVCSGAVYQDLDFSISFSTSYDGYRGMLLLSARWQAPKKSITSYRLYLDGRAAKYPSGGSTSTSVAAVSGSFSNLGKFQEEVDSYLGASHTYVLLARTAVGEDLYDVYEYQPPQVLIIESRPGDSSGLGQGTFTITHKQEANEGLDAYDGTYDAGQLPKYARIVSTVWDAEAGDFAALQYDARPLHSTSDVSLELSLASASREPVVLTSPQSNRLVFTLPGERYGNVFGSMPITIRQHDPLDPARQYPMYDVRKVIEKRGGAIALPDLQGAYDSGVPYAHFNLSFTEKVFGDCHRDGRFDLRDLAVMGDVWQHGEVSSSADIAGHDGLGLPDGRVNGLDLMAFCRQWARVVRDGFETGDFESLGWLRSGFPFWKVISSRSRSGSYCAQAGPIEDGGRTALMIWAQCRSGQITFWRKVSSERNYDVMRFSIDQKVMAEWSGELDWKRVSFWVEEGSHTFSWEYSKDDSSSSGNDTAWIDDVMFPAP